MSCPSLLYLSPIQNRAPFASDSVFTDLMLRDTLPESVLRVLQMGTKPEEIPARQEIFHDSAHPSCLILPEISGQL